MQTIGRRHLLELRVLAGDFALQVLLCGKAPGVAVRKEGDAARVGVGRGLQQQQVFDRRLQHAAVGKLLEGDQRLLDELR